MMEKSSSEWSFVKRLWIKLTSIQEWIATSSIKVNELLLGGFHKQSKLPNVDHTETKSQMGSLLSGTGRVNVRCNCWNSRSRTFFCDESWTVILYLPFLQNVVMPAENALELDYNIISMDGGCPAHIVLFKLLNIWIMFCLAVELDAMVLKSGPDLNPLEFVIGISWRTMCSKVKQM